MKPALLIAIIPVVAILVFFANGKSPWTEDADDKAVPPTRKTRRHTEADFWKSAEVPDPGPARTRTVIRPEDLGVNPNPQAIDHAETIYRAISENDLPSVQTAALSWFEKDPVAARDWLAMQPTLADLQPAISYIAHRISETGDIGTAIEWCALLSEGTLRDDTLFDIHALALRNRKITADEINLDLIPAGRREELLSGGAGD